MALTKVPSNLDAAVSVTQSQSDNSTNVATTAYVDLAISNLSDSAPAALNTLNEIAAALGDDANYASTTTAAIAGKLPLSGGAMTGAITTNSTFDGVDIAARDAVLTSTTTTAGAALPKAGGTLTGALVTSDLITANTARIIIQRSNDDSSIVFANNASGTPSSHTWAAGLNYSNSNEFSIAYASNGLPSLEQSKMVIDTSGNVGIGVTSSYPLTVQSGTAGSNHAIALRNNSTNNLSRLGFLQQDSATAAYTSIDGDGRSTGSLRFNTNNTERVRISADGYMQMGTSIGNSGYNAMFNIVDNAGTSSLIKLRNGTGNKSIQLYGDNNVEYGFVGLDGHSGAANLVLGSADNRSIRMQSGGMQIELTDGQGGTSATDTGSLSITNTDISGGGQVYNIRSGRYLQSNGTGWGTPDGLNPAVVIAKDNSTTNDRSMPGLIMHNEDSTDDAYGPSLSWGSRSTSGAYNTSYAWVIGKPTGNAVDTNWKAGELELYTQGSAYVATKPGLRITSSGLVQKPRQYDANGFFWLRGTSNPSVTGTQPVVFTVRGQAGSGNTSLTSGRYTTPVEGIYHFSTNVRIDQAANNTSYFRIAFYTGTTAILSQNSYGQGHSIYGPNSYSQNYFSMQTSWSVYLSAGTEVGVAVRYDSGSYIIHQESQFSGHLVG